MANKNYQKGRAFEYRVMKWLKLRGYYCMRAYGSKGLYDIIAIPPLPYGADKWFNYPLLIQAKTNGYVPPMERKKLMDKKWQGQVIVAWNNNGKIAMRTIDGDRVILDAL